MPRKRVIKEPNTKEEAQEMVKKGWWWLMKKFPIIMYPITVWLMFGGLVFLYNYLVADKYSVRDAIPLGEVRTQETHVPFTFFPTATAAPSMGDPKGPPIYWEIIDENSGEKIRKLWGYEDTTFEAKKVQGMPYILLYDKVDLKVKVVEFDEGSAYQQLKRSK